MKNLIHFVLSFLFLFQTVAPNLALSATGKVIQADKVSGVDAGKNYLEQGDAEIKITGINQYNDGASSRPVDCSGGASPAVTMTRSSTAPIEDKWSWIVTKDAVNRQGHGISIDFTAPKVKAMTLAARYLVNSGTFAAGTTGTSATDSDLIFYIFDVTNNRLIEPSTFRLYSNQTGWDEPYTGEFQTSSDSTSYRLCIHVATTSASAWTLKLDEISATLSKLVFGSVSGPTTAYTPTLTSSGGGSITLNTTSYEAPNGFWYQDGEYMMGQVSFKNGTGGAASGTAGAIQISIPSGYTVDTSKLTTTAGSIRKDGDANFYSSGTNIVPTSVYYAGSGVLKVIKPSISDFWQVSDLAAGSIVTLKFKLPIQGWANASQRSDSADTRVVACRYGTSSATSITGSDTQITYSSKVFDTHNMLSGSAIVIPVSGIYKISGSIKFASNTWTNGQAFLTLYKNGVATEFIANYTASTGSALASQIVAVGSLTLSLNAGDSLTFYGNQNQTASINLNGSALSNWISVERISGPSAIAASEEISARYTSTAGGSIGTSSTQQSFATKTFDTHGSWNGNTFSVQSPGKYEVTAAILTADVTLTTGQAVSIYLYKNGSLYSVLDRRLGNGTLTNVYLTGTDSVECIAGDTIKIYAISAVATSQNTASGYNYVSIKKVK